VAALIDRAAPIDQRDHGSIHLEGQKRWSAAKVPVTFAAQRLLRLESTNSDLSLLTLTIAGRVRKILMSQKVRRLGQPPLTYPFSHDPS
jgi:hypothetical protein